MLFNPDLYHISDVAATRWTLYQIGLGLLQLYAPYLPFVTETLYQSLYAKEGLTGSLHTTHFDNQWFEGVTQEKMRAGNLLIELASTVRRLKTEQKLSLKTELVHLTVVVAEKAESELLKSVELVIKGVTQAREISFLIEKSYQSKIDLVDTQWSAIV